jgi:hypothetical protein
MSTTTVAAVEAEAIEEVTKIMKRTSQVLKCLFPLLM